MGGINETDDIVKVYVLNKC